MMRPVPFYIWRYQISSTKIFSVEFSLSFAICLKFIKTKNETTKEIIHLNSLHTKDTP